MDRDPTSDVSHFPDASASRRRGVYGVLRDTTFRSLRHRNYRLYFSGQIVSFVGSWMQASALMWLMFDRTGDPRWPSWLLVAQVGPTVLLGTWGGQLADRLNKTKLIFATQSAFLIHAILLTTLVAANLADAWVILTLQILSGVVQGVDLPARLSLVPELVPREDLVNAVGLNSLLFNSARAVGPGVAALVFATLELSKSLLPEGTDLVRLGAAVCFGLNSISFVAVLFALHAIHCPTTRSPSEGDAQRSQWDGVRYLVKHPSMGGLVLLTLVICIFGWPVITLMPAYTRDVLGRAEQSYYALFIGLGIGALVAALTTATFVSVERRKGFLLAGAVTTGLGLFCMALTANLPVAILCTGSTGFGLILYLSTGQSTLQLLVPDEMRGRVMALWAMTLSASAPLGHLLAGHMTTVYGVVVVLFTMAVGVGLAASGLAVLLLRQQLRK